MRAHATGSRAGVRCKPRRFGTGSSTTAMHACAPALGRPHLLKVCQSAIDEALTELVPWCDTQL